MEPQEALESSEATQGEALEPQPIPEYVEDLARRARTASRKLAVMSTAMKNQALLAMAKALEAQSDAVLEANQHDLDALKESETGEGANAFRDRLTLTENRLKAMASGIREIATLPDPIGASPTLWHRPNGMRVGKMRVPLGVIGIIYESRPNVTADSAALCLKSGNACILRGGTEAIHSNTAIANMLAEAAEQEGVPPGAMTFIDRPDRAAAVALLKQTHWVDVIIPRGGDSLMKTVREESTIPVINHDKGVCHIYIDRDADLAMAQTLCINAKVQRPSTCNAVETLLVHHTIAEALFSELLPRLKEAGVEVRGCPKTCRLHPDLIPADDSDFGTEFLSLVLAVKVVNHMDDAMEHIVQYGSQHTEAIVTEDHGRAMRFLREVDAGTVMVNASTRLNDGYQFGLGAEIGISTTRLHARGPMGLEALTCSKFIVMGSGQIRE